MSISADGTTFVVGGFLNDGNGGNSGHVRVYRYNSTANSYAQIGMDINGEAAGDWFGYSVSISADGNTFVVGAPFNDGNGDDSGHVRVYKYNSTISSYAQIGMDIDGEAAVDWFGYSVSISADGATLVVGAPFNDGNGDGSGHVRVYKYNSTISSYAQIGMDINGEAAGDWFGYSVSISADGATFVVGAPLNDGNGINAGHVRVYKYNSTINSYAQFGLDIDGEAAANWFGYSVSISSDGNTFVVGAPYNDGSGHVRVYGYNSTAIRYTLIGLDINGEAAGDEFGFSVSISANGTTFVAGAVGNDGNGSSSGHVRVYRATVPTKAPTNRPTKTPTKQPTMVPTKKPTILPMTLSPTLAPSAPPENCGLFGWNLFCPRRGQCGLLKRLLNLGNCD